MSALLLIMIVITVVVVAGGATVVMFQKQKLARALQVLPGAAAAAQAPDSFAGAHTPEAKLHRRLVAAMSSLQSNPSAAGLGLLQTQAALARQALLVSERLVTIASLPENYRAAPLAQAQSAVDAIEGAVASVLTASSGDVDRASIDQAVADVTERVALLAEARREVDPGY